MVTTKLNPVGIDKPIQDMQAILNDKLLSWWNLSSSDYQCYGRCYRNKVDADYRPEVYTGSGEYKEVFLDDSLAALSFFGLNSGESTAIDGKKMTANIHLIFFVNLSKLKPTITHRADEEVRRDVQQALRLSTAMATGMVTGIANVLSEYPAWQKSPSIRDMHPFHCFRYNMTVNYSRNEICSFPINQ